MPAILEVAPDLDKAIHRALNIPVHPDRIVLARESPEHPGHLAFDLADQEMAQEFYDGFKRWVSRYLVLNELFSLGELAEKLNADGWYLIFDDTCQKILDDHLRWSQPIDVPGYQLHDYQNFSLNKAMERQWYGNTSDDRQYFWNWSAGAGKSYCSGAGLRLLFDMDRIDLAIVCTLSKLKINLARFLQSPGEIDAVVNDGDKAKRTRVYAERHQAYVMNFEKLRVDEEALTELVRGKRVAFVLDEAHKLIGDGAPNLSRLALDRLCEASQATVWPMSATVVGNSPLRFRDVFSLGEKPSRNPLSTKKDFVARYARSVKKVPAKTRSGGVFMFTSYDWDLAKLQEVRHRVSERTMAVRRPSNMPTVVVPIQQTREMTRVFDAIVEKAREARDREEGLASYYRLLRQVAVTPAALAVSEDPVAMEIHASDPTLALVPSAKVEVLNAQLESIGEAQDQAVCFVHWTTMGLHLISPQIEVPHVDHYGTGQSAKLSQKAQDDFKADPSIVAFLSSDAGAHGLNFQNARYVINIDPLYDYDIITQRNKRIDRADSTLDGLTSYVLIIEESVEARVWKVCNARMRLAAATQGTVEELTPEEIELARLDEEDPISLSWLIFGQ